MMPVRLLLTPLLLFGSGAGAWNLSATCAALYNFTATSWDNTCGWDGADLVCHNFSHVFPAITIGGNFGGHFGDNASALAPVVIHGGPTCRCGLEKAPAGSCIAGTNAQPAGHRSIKFEGIDRAAILDDDADNILPGWNAENHSWSADAPCQPGIVAQEKGPWPGIWLDHAAARLGAQSALFFKEYAKLGGQLDEIVLDTEIGPFLTWGVADNFHHDTLAAQKCATARWTAIQNDKRFPAVLAELLKRGLALGDCQRSKDGTATAACTAAAQTDPLYLAKAMKFVKTETTKEPLTNRNVWNALAFEREVAFWEVAIFKAAKQYFPHVRGSDWLYNKWSSDYCVPDPEGNMGCRTPGYHGAVPGGDTNGFSTTMMYGASGFNEKGNWAQDSPSYVLKEFFGVPSYDKTVSHLLASVFCPSRPSILVQQRSRSPACRLLSVASPLSTPNLCLADFACAR